MKILRFSRFSLVTFLVALCVVPVYAVETEIAKLDVGSGIFKTLGRSVALTIMPAPVYGVAVAGAPAPLDEGLGIASETCVYMPINGDWTNVTRTVLTPSDGGFDEYFGQSVDLNGLHVLVGSPGLEAVYIFLNGTTERKITSASSSTSFGRSVAFNGSSIAVGSGEKAYIFTDTSGGNWTNYTEYSFIPSNPQAANFGSAVDFEGGNLVVGAPTSESFQGLVYVYQGFTETEIAPYDNATQGQFGTSLSLDGSVIAIGAPIDSNATGAVYIVEDISAGSDWSDLRQTKIIPSDPVEWDRFGISVSLDGSTLAVGATRKEAGTTNNAGCVYIFKDTSTGGDWSSYSETMLQASDVQLDARLGMSVALADGKVLSGAYKYDVTQYNDEGAVYIFDADSFLFNDDFESGNTSRWSVEFP